MIIKSIDLDNFRNYTRLHLEPYNGVSIFYGNNAQGKSNLVEAVYLLAVNKSYRGAKDKEMIHFQKEESHIKLILEKNHHEYRIDFHLKQSGNKGIAVNSVPVRKLKDYLGLLNCVLFSPVDLQIVKNGPIERRKFMDTELCVLNSYYFNSLSLYKKALDQRNQLLKDIYFEPSLKDTLDVWDEQLIHHGKIIIEERNKFIIQLNELIQSIHSYLSGDKEKLQIFYEPDVSSENFKELLISSREKDLKLKTTGVGPHRDDFSFMLTDPQAGTIDARIYGSQGQQRTCALSLKMAEIEFVKRQTNDVPVLLLDDVLSELDSTRQQLLLQKIKNIQTFITCTGIDDFIKYPQEDSRVYQVVNGEISYGK